jgi:hypothetical protein
LEDSPSPSPVALGDPGGVFSSLGVFHPISGEFPMADLHGKSTAAWCFGTSLMGKSPFLFMGKSTISMEHYWLVLWNMNGL